MWCLKPSICSRGPAEESYQTSCLDIDLLARSKSKHILEKFCLPGSLTEAYLNSLFGTMCEHSEQTTQIQQTISNDSDKGGRDSPFVAGSRNCAKTSARQGRVLESKGADQACGVKWQELSVKYDQLLCSWKTHLCLWEEVLPWSLVILPKWGMTVSGVLFQHPTLERPISGTDSGFWPTPTTRDYKGAYSESSQELKPRWLLPDAVKKYPTPKARDGMGPSQRSIHAPMDALPNLVKLENGNGPMNPAFPEWLMGFPHGWTELKPLEMRKFQEWQQQHSES